jgi:hypothetical protein
MLTKEKVLETKDTDEFETNIVVKELKGRNVTILKTKTPAVIDSKPTVEEKILNSFENVSNKSEESILPKRLLKNLMIK